MEELPKWDLSKASDQQLEELISRCRAEERRTLDAERRAALAQLRGKATTEHARRNGLAPRIRRANPS